MLKLKVEANAPFRICQLTDIHLGKAPLNEADQKTLAKLEQLFKKKQYNLIMLTGDLLWGKDNSVPQASLEKLFTVLNATKIPVAITYGNHDSEGDYDRAELRAYEKLLEFPAEKSNVYTVFERENYTLDVLTATDEIRNRIFVWDSGAYSKWNLEVEYAAIEPEQVNWFLENARERKQADFDLGFMHIPLPEYKTTESSVFVGTKGEDVCSSELNSGLFYAFLRNQNIKAVFAGHDHDNNYQKTFHGVQLTYGNVTGYNCYGRLPRGVREITLYADHCDTKLVSFE